MRIGIDVAGLARFGVGVEDEVDAVIFLFIVSDVWCSGGEKGSGTFAANAMHLETREPVEPSRVVIMPNLQAEMNSLRSSIFSLMETSSIFLACRPN